MVTKIMGKETYHEFCPNFRFQFLGKWLMSKSIQMEDEYAGTRNINSSYQNMANETCDILVTRI